MAVEPDRNEGNRIRPKNDSNDALANEMSTGDEDEEERLVKGHRTAYQPKAEEWYDHMCAHTVFRKWCPSCVKFKCRSGIRPEDREIRRRFGTGDASNLD